MLKRLRLAAGLLLGAATVTGLAADQPADQPAPDDAATSADVSKTTSAPPLPPAACPVTTKPIDATQYSYFRGRRVYFASPEAKQAFELDPYAYAEKLKQQWEQLKPLRTQVRCPMTGEAIDLEIHVEGPRARIYFANADARSKWEQLAPDEQRRHLARTYTWQTTCAACDNLINPTINHPVNGQPIYYCCPHCPTAFEDRPQAAKKAVREEMIANRRAWRERLPAAAQAAAAAKSQPVGVADRDAPPGEPGE